jgi:hypothetical protein
MRWVLALVVALPLGACRQTVIFEQAPIDGGPGGTGGTGGAGGGPGCFGPPATIAAELPQVIVALDRSYGMNSLLPTVRNLLEQAATRYQKTIQWGFVEFPAQGNVCTSCGPCASKVFGPSANVDTFTFGLRACEQPGPACPEDGERPTWAALARCEDAYGAPAPFGRYVLLVTNGRPDCSMGQTSGCAVAQSIVRDLYNRQDVRTFVVAPGQIDGETSECLQELASAGGSNSNFRPAPYGTDLADEIGDVARTIAADACRLDVLSAPITNPDGAAVYWRNVEIPRNRDTGWDVTRQGFEVVLHGQWCDLLIDNGPAEFAVFPSCPPRF